MLCSISVVIKKRPRTLKGCVEKEEIAARRGCDHVINTPAMEP